MKQIILIALAGLVLSCSAQAASFDCTKAQKQVEKLICGNAELSKLDEDLAATYTIALRANSRAASVRQAQKQWLKDRNDCTDADCVKSRYAERLLSLANAEASKKTTVAANQKICTAVADTLRRISKMSPSSYEDPLYVDSIDEGGRSYAYQNVDLDGDGKPDDVKQGCGSPSDGTCTLYVKLSSGGGYEVDDDVFSVIHFQSKYYVLVGDTYPKKNIHRRMYALSGQGAKLVCESF